MSLVADIAVSVGHHVEFEFRVQNVAEEPLELEFRNGLAADFLVLSNGEEVWRWSAGRMFTQALWSERLAPGESISYEATWSDPDAGTYEVIASLEASNADIEARTGFDV